MLKSRGEQEKNRDEKKFMRQEKNENNWHKIPMPMS